MTYKEAFSRYTSKIDEGRDIRCFTISNTAKSVDQYYFTPIRRMEGFAMGGVVVVKPEEAIEFARLADGNFDYIAIDSENKINFCSGHDTSEEDNIQSQIIKTVRKSEIVHYKANDITVNATDIFISNRLMHKLPITAGIIGLGNVGFKIALKLLERGFGIKAYRRDAAKLQTEVNCLNDIKPKGTKSEAIFCTTKKECVSDVDVILGVTDTSAVVTEEDIKIAKKDVLLVDCGKACFTEEACRKHSVYYVDVSVTLMYGIRSIIESYRSLHPKFGTKTIDDKRYICGISGIKGDIVVSDINDITKTIGICDGNGNVIKDI
jgi:NAD binding domain of 6-phosphogluconate dehydrogenase